MIKILNEIYEEHVLDKQNQNEEVEEDKEENKILLPQYLFKNYSGKYKDYNKIQDKQIQTWQLVCYLVKVQHLQK